ncbi:MAG: hypothetical protein AAGA60_13255 [Cyanobacteria bacterium P01_E01_bin.42]
MIKQWRQYAGGLGEASRPPMAVRTRVGERRKGTRTVGVWGASPPENFGFSPETL